MFGLNQRPDGADQGFVEEVIILLNLPLFVTTTSKKCSFQYQSHGANKKNSILGGSFIITTITIIRDIIVAFIK